MELPILTTSMELVTPKEAKEYLTKRAKQRPIKPTKVKLFTEMMANGQWGQSEAAICFDVDGCLINGQHRMLALVEYGQPVLFNIVRGMAPDSFFVMDQGTKRSGGDTLASIGFTNPTDCAAIGRNLLSLSLDGKLGRNFTNQRELAEFCDPRSEYIEEAAELARTSRSFFPASHVGTLLYQALKIDEGKAREFSERFTTGVAQDTGDPILRLRDKLIKMKGHDKNQRPESSLPLFVTAWNAFYEGRKISRNLVAGSLFIKGMNQNKI